MGMGGAASGRYAIEFVACGGRDVALGTVLFSDPNAAARVRSEVASVDLEAVFARAHASTEVLA